ncbi:ROK family protein [Phreatobacter stygius]|uniref:ROK family protein n=1 Tax=Phreatobacter stygius TaxID=1940610 RepID=A0A4D7B3K2_9HYPH|nr:ROK family protein [Phreatobacter stygius]QCI65613.1 ROK family protein [Phreatobacter stygius]
MRIGIDLGGTKIEILALDDQGRELVRRRVPTPRDDYGAILGAIVGLVEGVEAELDQTGTVGVGIPGAVSPTSGLVKNANSVVLIGKPLDKDLAAMLGREVRLENDANCFALSEAVDGAGRDAHVVFGVILGTGVGAGISIGRQILRGRHLIAGEWGHNPLPWPSVEEVVNAPSCYCGRRGCIETWLSGPGFAADFTRATGRRLTASEIIAEAVREGEPHGQAAGQAYWRYVDRLGRALAHIINILDPDIILLGGGMGNVDRLYADLGQAMRAHVFSDAVATPVAKPLHGDSSGVRGAAWLWPPAS